MGLSAVKVRLFQFAKEAFCRKVIGVCFLLPEGEMSVVVQFVLLLPKGFHIARYLRFLEHLVHPFGEVAFLGNCLRDYLANCYRGFLAIGLLVQILRGMMIFFDGL